MQLSIFGITFLQPMFLLGILFIPIFLFLLWKNEKQQALVFSSSEDIKKIFGGKSITLFLKYTLFACIFLTFFLIFADPRSEYSEKSISKNGIDIVLVLDISDSMNAEDITPSRLEAAKKVIQDFVKKQETNRLGIVLFAGRPFTSIPLSFDYGIIDQTVERISTNMIDQSRLGGTAIGDGLLLGTTLFSKEEEYKNREKVIILLTDGTSNVGVPPQSAAKKLQDEGIKIYSIGVGSKQGGYIYQNFGPIRQKVPLEPLNEEALQFVSKISKGKYYRATDLASLQGVFSDLERLEKKDIEIDQKTHYTPLYNEFIYILVVLFIAFFLLAFIRND